MSKTAMNNLTYCTYTCFLLEPNRTNIPNFYLNFKIIQLKCLTLNTSHLFEIFCKI